MKRSLIHAYLIFTFLCQVSVLGNAEDQLTFERDVRPILKEHCFMCHGEGEEREGELDLRLQRFANSGR